MSIFIALVLPSHLYSVQYLCRVFKFMDILLCFPCILPVVSLLSGHSDVVMGALALNDDAIAERLKFLQNGN